ncbi:hypothetical protein EJB05_14088 [Eragrostis curvula]|uniref:DUF4216 domain-containing protein n=1 Tax=Eragrostis curvula TaxID=38414 RepID=A0A5J9VWL0_9POAL|nr:hypothetical protein EJB05_14088 [Eragrostis curvula]
MYIKGFLDVFWHDEVPHTAHEVDTLLCNGAGNGSPYFISWFSRKAQTEATMNAELRQVATGCLYAVKSFKSYDVNGYRFHTTSYEQNRPNRRTTNTGVFTPGDDGIEYYGRVKEIYELWFDGDDVYIVAQHATQVYYLPYPCQTDDRLKGWDVVYKVSPHGKLLVPNNEDYNVDPNTYVDGEFFQEDGLEGGFVIDLTEEIEMEVDNETVVEDDAGDEVHNANDLKLLERLHLDDDDIPPSEHVQDDIDLDDYSDDEANNAQDPDLDDYF